MNHVVLPLTFEPDSDVEEAEDYQLGGFHPIAIGDCFCEGRYKVMHKLGFGGSSTVWLARDRYGAKPLVALKALRADASPACTDELSSLAIPKMLQTVLPSSINIVTIEDYFFVQGPNGSHMFLVSPLAGPPVVSMSCCPGRAAGSRRLRADLARKAAKQTAMAIYHMHRAGVVHGDLTTSNVLFSLSPYVLRWSDQELYTNLGEPKTTLVPTYDGTPNSPQTQSARVVPIANSRLTNASFLQESVVLGDFGQSYAVASPPSDYEPGTVIHYFSPEARFENRAGLEADVWALGCTIFEMRAGFPLFEVFFGSDIEVLVEIVSVLGRLPDPWWSAFEEHSKWFEENGEPRSQQRMGLIQARKTSIRELIRSIGVGEERPTYALDGPMIEKFGVRVDEREVELLGDLLEKMMRYRPEERIKMEEVIAHLWFAFTDSAL
ncbi:kinase-like protein [Peniophora sp. CONT]|nr:kinase-like protein [Peniophora sp. CONT]